MTQGKQFGLSATQKIAMWSRRKAGQSLPEIGRAFGKSHSSIRCVVPHHGGFVPALRQRSLLALTLTEREEISRGIASGSSIREMAKLLDRAASTVSRELHVMVAVLNLEPRKQMTKFGSQHYDRSSPRKRSGRKRRRSELNESAKGAEILKSGPPWERRASNGMRPKRSCPFCSRLATGICFSFSR